MPTSASSPSITPWVCMTSHTRMAAATSKQTHKAASPYMRGCCCVERDTCSPDGTLLSSPSDPGCVVTASVLIASNSYLSSQQGDRKGRPYILIIAACENVLKN